MREPGYNAGALEALTVRQIKALASGSGYSITKKKKADIISEFLEQRGDNDAGKGQACAADYDHRV